MKLAFLGNTVLRPIVYAAVVASLILAGCAKHNNNVGSNAGGSSSSSTLKVGIIPFEQADVIQKGFTPLANYIAKKAGKQQGEVYVSPSYSGILQALASDQIDVAYLSPLAYVLAASEYQKLPENLVPLGMPYFRNSLTYKGVIFVRADSGINSIKDLKGKSFAFADRTSASGYLYPAGLMKEAGIGCEGRQYQRFLKRQSGVQRSSCGRSHL
jgi:phosphonate transport system substrate-binding protein